MANTQQNQTNKTSGQNQQASRSGMQGNNEDQARDSQGRFTDDDDSTMGKNAQSRSSGDDDQPRDAQGRFTDDDDSQSRSASNRDNDRSGSTRNN